MWYTFVRVCVSVCVCDGDADTVCQFSTGYCTLDISIGFPEHARKPFDGTYLVFFYFFLFIFIIIIIIMQQVVYYNGRRAY